MAKDKNNRSSKKDLPDWSEFEELDLDEFDDVDGLQSRYWAPYEGETGSRRNAQSYEQRQQAAYEVSRQKKRRGRRGHRVPVLLKVLLYLVFVCGGSLLLATAGWIAANDVLALNKEPVTATVEVATDTTITQLSEQLKADGIIDYPWLFRLYCNVTDSEKKLTFGSFEVNTDMDYHALVSAMSASSVVRKEVTVTIPEGYTLDQVFALLVEKGVCASVEELQTAAAEHDYDFSFLADLPAGDYHRLEGYLFPDTYTFYQGHDPVKAINKLLVNFDNQYSDSMRQLTESQGYTMREVLIMASVIEKESNGSDQRNISSVMHNRLNSGKTDGLLQMDATVQYILERRGEERKDKLTDEDLNIDSPYNTYKYPGLPEGPICNPSLVALQAALDPNDTDYYYYLHDSYGDGHFYSDFSEFEQAKENYLNGNYNGEEKTNNEGTE